MRMFKVKPFTHFAGREWIADVMLCYAVERAAKSLVDADLESPRGQATHRPAGTGQVRERAHD